MRTQKVKIGVVNYAPYSRFGPAVRIVDDRTEYKDGDPLRQIMLVVDDPFSAMALMRVAREALREQRKRAARMLADIDAELVGNS